MRLSKENKNDTVILKVKGFIFAIIIVKGYIVPPSFQLAKSVVKP